VHPAQSCRSPSGEGPIGSAAAEAAHQLTPQRGAGLRLVAHVERPGEFVEGVVEGRAFEQRQIARHRTVGDTADGIPGIPGFGEKTAATLLAHYVHVEAIPDDPAAWAVSVRGAARLAAVQALYQMDIAGAGINDVFAEFESHWIGGEVEGEKYLPAEAAFFRDIVSGVVRDQAKLDPLIDDALARGWPLKRIDAILRAVLRAGSYELEHRKDVPGRVVVSEYVDVAHAFVEKDETGMVNAVLDQIARRFRADEFSRG
jgi:N utilization substance protein B